MAKGTLKFQNKRGIEAMVSYVILVLIAISISVFVYAYLELYVPEQRRECEVDLRIIITNISCVINENENYHGLSFEMENRGLFNVSGVYVKFDNATRQVKTQLSAEDARLRPPLAPGNVHSFNYLNINSTLRVARMTLDQNAYELEIEPAVLQEGYLVPCKNSIVTYPVTCRVQ